MKTRHLIGLLVSVPLILTACGEKESPPPARKKLTTRRDKAPAGVAQPIEAETPSGTEAPSVSIEEIKKREMARKLKKLLAAAKDVDAHLEALGDIARLGKAALPLLSDVKSLTRHEDPEVRAEAYRTLAAIAEEDARPLLENGFKDDDETVRMAAVEAWKTAGIKDVTPLFTLLEDEIEPSVQYAVAVAVRDLGQPFNAAQAARAVEDVAPAAAKPLIEFLVKQKDAKYVDLLVENMSQADPSVRVVSARGLGELGVKNKAVYTALVSGLDDDDDRVQKASIDALKKLTGETRGFDMDTPIEERRQAAEAWKEWLRQQT